MNKIVWEIIKADENHWKIVLCFWIKAFYSTSQKFFSIKTKMQLYIKLIVEYYQKLLKKEVSLLL